MHANSNVEPSKSEADKAAFIRALYDAADQVMRDRVDMKQSAETSFHNAQRFQMLVAEARSIGSVKFGEAVNAALDYLTKRSFSSCDETVGRNDN